MKRRTVKNRHPRIYFEENVWRVQVGKLNDTFAKFIEAAKFAKLMLGFGTDNNWQRGRRMMYSGVLPFQRQKQPAIVHLVDLKAIDQIVIEAIAAKRKFLFTEDPTTKVAEVGQYIEEITAPPSPPAPLQVVKKRRFDTMFEALEAGMQEPKGIIVLDSIASDPPPLPMDRFEKVIDALASGVTDSMHVFVPGSRPWPFK